MITAGMVAAAPASSSAAAEGAFWLAIENRSEHPVKVALPGAPALTVPAGGEPARIEAGRNGDGDGGTGVTVRLWWTSDPRQLCQIYTPWGRTVTVTGSREILCRSR
jgi:hypothetical protein